ncbi:MAG: DUF4397 domain-containing protein [Pelobium sp.]
MIRPIWKNNLHSILLFAVLLFLVSCKDTVVPVLQFGEAKIRVINAIPETGSISFYVNDTLKTPTPLLFGDNVGYQNISAGTASVAAKVGINTINKSQVDLYFKNAKNYTVFIAAKVGKDSLTYISTEDNLTVLTDTTSKVRFINASPDSPNLDLVFYKGTDSISTIKNINYRSGTEYVQLKPGTYNIQLRASSKMPALANNTGFVLAKGKIYTLFAKGLVKDNGSFKLNTVMLKDN